MSGYTRIVKLMLLGAFVCGVASAIEPTHYGKLGNPEEPALRPVKAVFRGLVAFKNNVKQSARQGNDKVPIIGAVEAFRGVRRGIVEFAGRTCWGMAGSYPRDPKKNGPTNEYIDNEPLLRTVTDTAPAAALFGATGGAGAAVVGSGVVLAAQKAIDHAANAQAPREEAADTATALHGQAPPVHKQARVPVDKSMTATGNLLKLAKK